MVGHPDPDIDVVAISINADLLQKTKLVLHFLRWTNTPCVLLTSKNTEYRKAILFTFSGFQWASFRQIGSMLLCVQV